MHKKNMSAFYKLQKHPLFFSLMILVGFNITLILLLTTGILLSEGNFTYTLDDPYIHLAIARNLLEHHIWGVTPYQFSSSSSSLLWPLLIAILFKFVGYKAILPLVLNVIFANILLYQLTNRVIAFANSTVLRLFFISFFILFTRLPYLVLSGMEHILHILAIYWLITAFASALERGYSQKSAISLLITTLIATTIRYESLLIIALIVIALLLSRQIRLAALVAVFSALPITIFGLWSIKQGGFFLPNSVIIKTLSEPIEGIVLWFRLMEPSLQMVAGDLLMLLLVIVHFLLVVRWRRGAVFPTLSLIYLIALGVTLFVSFRSQRYVPRYNGYLYLLGIVAICQPHFYGPFQRWETYITNHFSRLQRYGVLALLLFPALVLHAHSILLSPLGMTNIYEQQVQMGKFIGRYYEGMPIVANDIGAINFYGNGDCLDYYGLGTTEVVPIRRLNSRTEAYYALFAKKKPRIAIVYDEWFKSLVGPSPDQWVLVGRWGISNNVAAAFSVVSFGEEEVTPLKEHLEAFQAQLPRRVNYALAPELRD